MQIRPLELDDDAAMTHAHVVYAAAHAMGRQYATAFPLEEWTASFRARSTVERRRGWVAVDGEQVLGGARLDLRLTDNTHLAEMDVWVDPARWREGIGTRLVAHLRAEAEAAGRTLAAGWVTGVQLTRTGEAQLPEPPAIAFARASGLTERNTNVHRVLELPVAPEQLDALATEASRHHAGYTIIGWPGPCPDEYVAAYCQLKSAMVTEAPLGEVEMEPEVWDEARLREGEAETADMGRLRHSVLALAPNGSVAGFNEVVHAAHDPGRLWNWDTLVVRAHRGHRLGLALKVANIRAVQKAHPEGREVHTFNATTNTAMVAVNDAVGFFPVERVGEWQGPLADLPTHK